MAAAWGIVVPRRADPAAAAAPHGRRTPRPPHPTAAAPPRPPHPTAAAPHGRGTPRPPHPTAAAPHGRRTPRPRHPTAPHRFHTIAERVGVPKGVQAGVGTRNLMPAGTPTLELDRSGSRGGVQTPDKCWRRARLFNDGVMSPASSPRRPVPAAESLEGRVTTAIGVALLDERRRRRWTARELAARARVSVATVTNVEAGRTASLATYARLAVALGLTLDVSLEGKRRRASRGSSDLVHAAMGELEARWLSAHGFEVADRPPVPALPVRGSC